MKFDGQKRATLIEIMISTAIKGLLTNGLVDSFISDILTIYDNDTVSYTNEDTPQIVQLFYDYGFLNYTIVDHRIVYHELECSYAIGHWVSQETVQECANPMIDWCGFTQEDVFHFYQEVRMGRLSADSHAYANITHSGESIESTKLIEGYLGARIALYSFMAEVGCNQIPVNQTEIETIAETISYKTRKIYVIICII